MTKVKNSRLDFLINEEKNSPASDNDDNFLNPDNQNTSNSSSQNRSSNIQNHANANNASNRDANNDNPNHVSLATFIRNRQENPGGSQPTVIKPYRRGPYFYPRLFALFLCMILTVIAFSGCYMFLPLIVGRFTVKQFTAVYSALIFPVDGHSTAHSNMLESYKILSFNEKDIIIPWLFGQCLIKLPFIFGHQVYQFMYTTFFTHENLRWEF